MGIPWQKSQISPRSEMDGEDVAAFQASRWKMRGQSGVGDTQSRGVS